MKSSDIFSAEQGMERPGQEAPLHARIKEDLNQAFGVADMLRRERLIRCGIEFHLECLTNGRRLSTDFVHKYSLSTDSVDKHTDFAHKYRKQILQL